ncbi:MAG: hypothetical protein ACLSD6_01895 [Clostridium sp.]
MEIAGEALTHYYYDEERFCTAAYKPCDPNLLGVISDMVNCVATVDCCVVYNETPIDIKCRYEVQKNLPASDLAEKSAGIGAGGGHTNKAGGMLMNTCSPHSIRGKM